MYGFKLEASFDIALVTWLVDEALIWEWHPAGCVTGVSGILNKKYLIQESSNICHTIYRRTIIT